MPVTLFSGRGLVGFPTGSQACSCLREAGVVENPACIRNQDTGVDPCFCQPGKGTGKAGHAMASCRSVLDGTTILPSVFAGASMSR